MKKYSKLMAILLVFAMILPGVAQAAPVVEAEEINSEVIRLAGADRIKTSVKVSQTAYKDGADSVVIVGYEGEVDALAGTLLAHAKKGPVLFTKKGKLSEDTKTEIARLGAKNVYILGGTAAIEDAVKTELETLKYTVKRISGSNREGTAAAVAKEVGGKTTHVFLARGYGDLRAVLADALAVGPASAKGNMAVLLTRTDKVPAATLKSMKDLGVTNVTIVGGEGAVNSGVKTELETLKYTVDRLSGTTREGTAIAIANKYFAGKTNALVANGYGSPDALVGGYLGAAIDAPILFSQANKVSEVTTDYLKANTEKAWILGGEGVVNKEVFNKVLGAVDVKVKEDITVTETTKLNKDYKSVKVTGNDIVVDLNGKTVETLTVTGNDTIIKNGTIVNIIVGKDVVNVTLEDIIDDGDGNHEFEGGGAESIILKGSTQLKSKIEISSTTPIQIRTDNLGKGKGITGKVTINTEAAVTIAAPVSELEVKKENKNIKIKAEVGKISALADANITVDKDIKMPTLEKAAGIKATATDSSGKEQDFKENDKLEPTTPVVPTPTPPSTGGGSGGNVAVSAIRVDKATLTLTAGGVTGTITATVSPSDATNKTVIWTSSNEAVATVAGGVVTPLIAGTTTITAKTVDGSFTATTAVTVEAPAPSIDVTLQEIFAQTDKIVISIFKTEEIDPSADPATREIPSLEASDFILIKDFGGANPQITGFTLEPGSGTWEYEIKPAEGQSFALGSYRLGFSKAGYNPAHIDFVIEADLTAYTAALAAVAEADYTAESWEAYQLVVAANVVTVANSQAEVDAATLAITTAQADLVEKPVETEAPLLGDVTLTNDVNGNLVLTVKATDNGELASLEVDHSLEKVVPEFTVTTEPMEDPTTGAKSTFADGTWTLSFGEQVSQLVRNNANGTMTFYFVIKDVAGNQFGDMYNVTPEMTRKLDVPAAPVVEDTEAPKLGDVTLTNDNDGNLVLTVKASDNEGLASLEVDHSLGSDGQGNSGIVPEFTVGTDDVEASEATMGAGFTFADGTWTLSFGKAMSDLVRANANGEMTFYFVITDVNGNRFGSMSPPTAENTRTFEVPAAPVEP